MWLQEYCSDTVIQLSLNWSLVQKKIEKKSATPWNAASFRNRVYSDCRISWVYDTQQPNSLWLTHHKYSHTANTERVWMLTVIFRGGGGALPMHNPVNHPCPLLGTSGFLTRLAPDMSVTILTVTIFVLCRHDPGFVSLCIKRLARQKNCSAFIYLLYFIEQWRNNGKAERKTCSKWPWSRFKLLLTAYYSPAQPSELHVSQCPNQDMFWICSKLYLKRGASLFGCSCCLCDDNNGNGGERTKHKWKTSADMKLLDVEVLWKATSEFTCDFEVAIGSLAKELKFSFIYTAPIHSTSHLKRTVLPGKNSRVLEWSPRWSDLAL